MPRKNRRRKTGYRGGLGFNPRKYVTSCGDRFDTTGRTCCFHDPRYPHRGELWFADLGKHEGMSIQEGYRPVLVVSNNDTNIRAETINVLPTTRQMKKMYLTSHTELSPGDVIDKQQELDRSLILAEQITTISKTQLNHYIGRIRDIDLLTRIDGSIMDQLALSKVNRQVGVKKPDEKKTDVKQSSNMTKSMQLPKLINQNNNALRKER